jgi:hypothetical protein
VSCSTDFDLAQNLGRMQVATSVGMVDRTSGLTAGFSVADDQATGSPLVGSVLTGTFEALGVLDADALETAGAYRLDLLVFDDTEGVTIAGVKVAEGETLAGPARIDVSEPVVLALPLTEGHDYSIVLRLTGAATGDGVGGNGVVDLITGRGFFGWSGLTLRVGRTAVIPDLVERIEDLEQQVTRLTAALRALNTEFQGHSHEYLTGKGVGHNNTVANTAGPESGDDDGMGENDDRHNMVDTKQGRHQMKKYLKRLRKQAKRDRRNN